MNKKFLLAGSLLCAVLAGCGAAGGSVKRQDPTGPVRIAVLPVDNLSGTAVSSAELQQALQEKLRSRDVAVVPQSVIDAFMTRNRIRYVGGVTAEMGRALQADEGIGHVLVTALELYDEELPLKIALTSRLVATGANPAVVWMESVALAGDETPGLLGLGRIDDPRVLRDKALGMLIDSLGRYLAGQGNPPSSVAGKYRPKMMYNALSFEKGATPTVAILPFLNESPRRYAGEIAALHVVRELSRGGLLQAIEPGMIRDSMLAMRLIMNDGVSLSAAEMMADTLDTDFILTGKVFDYRDARGAQRDAKVEFSIQIIERESRKVVWSSRSSNVGDDGIFFFDLGRPRTAHAAAAAMTRAVVAAMRQNR